MQQREQKLIEEQIKALRRLPGNKKCADCKSLSNPYVCSDYNTFVCTRCSGIHRELGHRVKSVTAEIFTREEVAALKRGGNQRHNAAYLATWTESEFPEPAADDNRRIKKWFEEKYERRRWYRDPATLGQNFNQQPTQPEQMQQPQVQQPQQQQQQQQPGFVGNMGQPAVAPVNQGMWNVGSTPSSGVTTNPVMQQYNSSNQFPAMMTGAPANNMNNVAVNPGFNANIWGASGATANPVMQPTSQQNVIANPLQAQKPVQQSSQDVLGLLMMGGNTTATTNTNTTAVPSMSYNQTSMGFGGFGASTQPQPVNNVYGMNTASTGMGFQPTMPTTTNTTVMNPSRAQPLSRGQQNNPFAGLVDMAPSVSGASTPASTSIGQSSSAAPGGNSGMDSLFSSAPQSQASSAQPASKPMSLIDF